ncbi:hypothetical protein J4558_24995 [Leptolyngbya sp. 15MV]|nr:hypothetical protein J4558_24995 [Leptolyngbya sp. 15MV]
MLGGKFLLDIVEEGEPLIYVAQQGRPRVVLFGPAPALVRPVTFSMWGERLMIVGDEGQSDVRVMYRAPDRVLDTGETLPGVTVTARAPADLEGLVQFMVRRPTPEDPRPGLDLAYSDVVGVLYELHRAGWIEGSFAVEQDLLQARLLAATEQTTAAPRPETPAEAERQLRVMRPVREEVGGQRPGVEPEPLVVPLPPVQPRRR